METPIQGHVALLVSIISVVLVLAALSLALRAEKKRPADRDDDH